MKTRSFKMMISKEVTQPPHKNYFKNVFTKIVIFLVRQVPGQGPEQRESVKTVTLSAVGDDQWPVRPRGKIYSVEAWCHCVKVWSVVVQRELSSLP